MVLWPPLYIGVPQNTFLVTYTKYNTFSPYTQILAMSCLFNSKQKNTTATGWSVHIIPIVHYPHCTLFLHSLLGNCLNDFLSILHLSIMKCNLVSPRGSVLWIRPHLGYTKRVGNAHSFLNPLVSFVSQFSACTETYTEKLWWSCDYWDLFFLLYFPLCNDA